MADEGLMIDTSILIDYFRKSDKSKTRLITHFQTFSTIYISSITEFEIYNGSKEFHKDFWDKMLEHIIVLDFNSKSARKAADIVVDLKAKRLSIDKPDLFIAATAISNDLKFDTLNVKHFYSITGLKLI